MVLSPVWPAPAGACAGARRGDCGAPAELHCVPYLVVGAAPRESRRRSAASAARCRRTVDRTCSPFVPIGTAVWPSGWVPLWPLAAPTPASPPHIRCTERSDVSPRADGPCTGRDACSARLSAASATSRRSSCAGGSEAFSLHGSGGGAAAFTALDRGSWRPPCARPLSRCPIGILPSSASGGPRLSHGRPARSSASRSTP